MQKKLVLVVVDGMTPAAFERAVESGRAPALAFLAEHGDYRQATSVFPSLTPVCLTSIATGAGPGVHHIPSLVWWNRQERRIVEYGSSFAALRAAGLSQSLVDTIFNMNARHLSRGASTVYEALEDAGLVAGAVNITCYRGRHRYLPTVPGLRRAAYGPRRFFFYGLFESDRTGAPFAVRSRRAGSVDAYAAAVGRWLVTRDGFDFLAYYLSGYDFASHAAGPDGEAADARARAGRRGDPRAPRRGGRAGRVPRALRRRASLRSRPDPGRARGAPGGAVRGSRRSGRRDRLEPRRAGLPPPGRARRRGRAGAAARRLRGGRRHAPPRGGRGRRSPRRCGCARSRSSSTPTPPGAHARRSRTRTPASCSSRRRRAGSSPTSAAAITRAAAATARSSPATRSCRS